LKDYISPSDVYKIREKYMLSLVAADHKFNLESGSFSRWEDGEPVPPEIAFVLIEVLDRDDVIVRKEYLIENQGRCITPMTIKVKVVCVDETTVWYTKEGDPRVYDTTVERFTEILRGNQK
jgi:capsid portal protein